MSHQSRRCLRILDVGVLGYAEALALQQATHADVAADQLPATVLLVEHPSVLTLGKHADPSFITTATESLGHAGISLHPTDRGGEVTAHNPGQMVVYPILPLSRWGYGARDYVQTLESIVINTLAHFGIHGCRDAQYPGVWVGKNKICAIGVRIKNRVSMHGIALNVDNDLSIFKHIIPCGIHGRGVTSVARELGQKGLLPEVKAFFLTQVSALFQCDMGDEQDEALSSTPTCIASQDFV